MITCHVLMVFQHGGWSGKTTVQMKWFWIVMTSDCHTPACVKMRFYVNLLTFISWPPSVSNESNILCVIGYWLSANYVATLCAALWFELFHRNWRLEELLSTWSSPLCRWGICLFLKYLHHERWGKFVKDQRWWTWGVVVMESSKSLSTSGSSVVGGTLKVLF